MYYYKMNISSTITACSYKQPSSDPKLVEITKEEFEAIIALKRPKVKDIKSDDKINKEA